MFENLYTTKMSAHFKKLQNRLLRIHERNGRISKVIACIVFALILCFVVTLSCFYVFQTQRHYFMTDETYSVFTQRMFGSIMAEMDYVDGERLIFHYFDGIFVYSLKNSQMEYKFDLDSFNCAKHQQGTFGLHVIVSEDGNQILLANYGEKGQIEKYDNYFIDLEKQTVKKTKKDTLDNPFKTSQNTKDTFKTVSDASGWYSQTCMILPDETVCYLTTKSAHVENLLFCTQKGGIYKEQYIFNQKKETVSYFNPEEMYEIQHALLEVNGYSFTLTDATKLARLEEMMKNATPMKAGTGCPFVAELYVTRKDGCIGRITLAADSCSVYESNGMYYDYHDGNNGSFLYLFDLVQFPMRKEIKDTIYLRVARYLMDECNRVCAPSYEILSLDISGWQEEGNEAIFSYKVSYKNPDKAKKQKENIQSKIFVLKVVDRGDSFEVYHNIASRGITWQRTTVDALFLK